MASSRIERPGALAGIIFFALGLTAAIAGPAEPGFAAEPREIVAYFGDDVDRLLATQSLYLLSVPFLFWFVSALRSHLGDGTLGRVAYAGGIGGGALCLAAAACNVMGALRFDERGTIDAQTATVLHDLGMILFGLAAPMAFSALVAAVAVAALRTDALPRLLGYFSAPLAVALALPPINYVAVIVFVFWTGAVGAAALLAARAGSPARTAAAAA